MFLYDIFFHFHWERYLLHCKSSQSYFNPLLAESQANRKIVGKTQFRHAEQLPEQTQHNFECYFMRFIVTMCTKYPRLVYFYCFLIPGISLLPPRHFKCKTGRGHFIVFWCYVLSIQGKCREASLSYFSQNSPDLHFDVY